MVAEVVVVPAYNEGKTIAAVIAKIKTHRPSVVVVDDGSNDNTFQQAKDAGAVVLKHKVNLGKGRRSRPGVITRSGWAQKRSSPWMLTGSMIPRRYPNS